VTGHSAAEDKVRIFDSSPAIIDAAAQTLIELANQSITDRGIFSLALAGGSTPRGLYQKLATSPLREAIDWTKVHIFLGDERAVAPEDELSNVRMAREALLNHVPLQPEHIHLPNGAAPDLEAEAQRYEALIREWGPLDLVLLGMGRDGHTASLFPNSPALDATEQLFVATPPATLEPYLRRLTLTFPGINAAHNVLFLITGADKAAALASCLAPANDSAISVSEIPSRGVQPQGNLNFYIDTQAAQQLSL
jgi:6-phosphogluconolactonase